MIRTLLLPAALVGLLGGCVSAGYSYRGDGGGYYYGQPAVEYRYHDYYGPSYYGPYRYGYYPYRYGYGYPWYSGWYGHGFPYYWDPFPRYYYRPRHDHKPPPGTDPPPTPRPPGNDDRPPWRDFGRRTQPRILQPQPDPAIPRTLEERRGPLTRRDAGPRIEAPAPMPAPRMAPRRSEGPLSQPRRAPRRSSESGDRDE